MRLADAHPIKALRAQLTNILVGLLLTVLAVIFSMGNIVPVEIHFLSLSSSPLPLYIPVFIAFLTGFIGGVIALSFSRHKHKKEIAALRQHNHLLQQELDNLRTIPLQDDL